MNTSELNMNTRLQRRGIKMEKKHVTARLNKKLVDKIKEMASKEGRSLNNMIERLLEGSLNEK